MMPTDVPIVDTYIGFPKRDKKASYAFLAKQTKDRQAREGFSFPAAYMFKDDPATSLPEGSDPIGFTLEAMGDWNIEYGLVNIDDSEGSGLEAVKRHPDRFLASTVVDPNRGMDEIRRLVHNYEVVGVKAVCLSPMAMLPQVAINDKKMYPIYAKCVELGIPAFCLTGIPGPRVRYAVQSVELIDEVMFDFPELTFVMQHGGEPWTELAVKLMLKWPGLHYSTSAFAPRYYPQTVINYANSRGADKIIYGGYFPMALSLDRIMGELPQVPFKPEVWPRFLRRNALRVLGIE